MSFSFQETSDRMEIQEAMVRYSYGLDQRLWSEWGLAFTDDAVFDFREAGMSIHTVPQIRAIFSASDANRLGGQHLQTNFLIWLDGDTARARSEYSLAAVSKTGDPAIARRNSGGGWYEDELVRTPAGWRIRLHKAIVKWNHVEEIPWAPLPNQRPVYGWPEGQGPSAPLVS
jgi:hypothetical protein